MKTSSQVSHQSPRTDARQSKLRALTAEQTRALMRWLFEENTTYTTARERLANQFGVKLSMRLMHNFWNQQSKQQMATSAPNVLLDVILKPACPMRLLVHQDGRSITLTRI